MPHSFGKLAAQAQTVTEGRWSAAAISNGGLLYDTLQQITSGQHQRHTARRTHCVSDRHFHKAVNRTATCTDMVQTGGAGLAKGTAKCLIWYNWAGGYALPYREALGDPWLLHHCENMLSKLQHTQELKCQRPTDDGIVAHGKALHNNNNRH